MHNQALSSAPEAGISPLIILFHFAAKSFLHTLSLVVSRSSIFALRLLPFDWLRRNSLNLVRGFLLIVFERISFADLGLAVLFGSLVAAKNFSFLAKRGR